MIHGELRLLLKQLSQVLRKVLTTTSCTKVTELLTKKSSVVLTLANTLFVTLSLNLAKTDFKIQLLKITKTLITLKLKLTLMKTSVMIRTRKCTLSASLVGSQLKKLHQIGKIRSLTLG